MNQIKRHSSASILWHVLPWKKIEMHQVARFDRRLLSNTVHRTMHKSLCQNGRQSIDVPSCEVHPSPSLESVVWCVLGCFFPSGVAAGSTYVYFFPPIALFPPRWAAWAEWSCSRTAGEYMVPRSTSRFDPRCMAYVHINWIMLGIRSPISSRRTPPPSPLVGCSTIEKISQLSVVGWFASARIARWHNPSGWCQIDNTGHELWTGGNTALTPTAIRWHRGYREPFHASHSRTSVAYLPGTLTRLTSCRSVQWRCYAAASDSKLQADIAYGEEEEIKPTICTVSHNGTEPNELLAVSSNSRAHSPTHTQHHQESEGKSKPQPIPSLSTSITSAHGTIKKCI